MTNNDFEINPSAPPEDRTTATVDIIIPAYNTAKYLPFALESVISQTTPQRSLPLSSTASVQSSNTTSRKTAGCQPQETPQSEIQTPSFLHCSMPTMSGYPAASRNPSKPSQTGRKWVCPTA
jgi:hypothetical protein